MNFKTDKYYYEEHIVGDNKYAWRVFDNNVQVAFIGLKEINKDTLELRFSTKEDLRNKGYMTTIVGDIIRYAFENLNVKQIQGICDIKNVASARVMEKNGMKNSETIDHYHAETNSNIKCYLYKIENSLRKEND